MENFILTWGGPIFIGLIVMEIVFTLIYDRDVYKWKDFAASTFMGLGASALQILFAKAMTLGFLILIYNIFNPEVDGVATNLMGYKAFGWSWGLLFICQICDDFSYYWYHRANHEIRFFWAAHIVHHSSENFNLGTGIRNGWFTLLYKPLFYVWMPMIGFSPYMVLACMAIESLWQFQLHTHFVTKMGIFEKVFNTQRHHHVHHARNLEYLDKNHGGYLIIFDKMFGTYADLDESIEMDYGVLHPPKNDNPVEILTHEYVNIWQDVKQAKGPKNKFMYIFGPPGWSPDGSRMTVRQMQREGIKPSVIRH